MGLFGTNAPTNLEQVLGQQADTQAAGLQDAAVQRKKRLVAQEAHSGRLMSGVSDYPLTDLATSEASGIGDVYSNLAGALGQIPAEDYLNQNQNQNNLNLAQLIGNLNKPSALQEALGALGSAGNIAGKFAAFV